MRALKEIVGEFRSGVVAEPLFVPVVF